jgi:ADP-ribose pyrophosphatase YjhB (NUDIX family)
MEETSGTSWVGGVCVKNDQVLLVHRINHENLFNKEYFVFPGKQVSQDEAIEDALRKAFEDFSMTVELNELLYANDDSDDKEYYYLCHHLLGQPHLAKESNESKEMEEGRQVFIPMWVPLRELDDLIVYPESVKEALLAQQDELLS